MDQNEELRKAVLAYFAAQNPTPKHTRPDAPGIAPTENAKNRDAAATLYGEAIMRKPASAITPDEREFLRRDILAALAENQ
jgi:hypothetical protein